VVALVCSVVRDYLEHVDHVPGDDLPSSMPSTVGAGQGQQRPHRYYRLPVRASSTAPLVRSGIGVPVSIGNAFVWEWPRHGPGACFPHASLLSPALLLSTGGLQMEPCPFSPRRMCCRPPVVVHALPTATRPAPAHPPSNTGVPVAL
jgi:hypothetical protein